MATVIEYGGRPSYELRMKASKLPPGAKISGYTGLVPGMKYTFGANYAELTHTIHMKDNKEEEIDDFSQPKLEEIKITPEYIEARVGPLNKELSSVKRQQKYVFDLPPGYGGYIPKFNRNSLSLTFRKANFKALEDHIISKKESEKILEDIQREAKKTPCLKPVKCDAETTKDLRKSINTMKSCDYPGKTQADDPPIVGYCGWIPRTRAFIESFGIDYRRGASLGLKTFDCYQRYYKERLENPKVNLTREETKYKITKEADVCTPYHPPYRIYPKPGMLPRYAGSVPGLPFDFGRTYGESTRQMECCKHDEANFGVYMKKKIATQPVETVQVIF